MDFALLIPIVLFICITLSIKYIVDARLRRRLAETHATEDLVKAMLVADERSRQMSAFKWGLVMVAVGGAFGLIDVLNLDGDEPGTWGILFAFAGAGLLGFHWLSSKR